MQIMPRVGILHNIRSIHNVASIFRTADAAGFDKLFLTGYTPGPIDRFGMPEQKFIKVSLGAEKNIAWEMKKNLSPLLNTLKKNGYSVVAFEQHPKALHYRTVSYQKPFAIMLGNERVGLSARALQHADYIAQIPMRGKKESLNVSVVAGIAFFESLID